MKRTAHSVPRMGPGSSYTTRRNDEMRLTKKNTFGIIPTLTPEIKEK